MVATTKDLYELGETPPLGHVPKQMYASLIRPERFGEPRQAFQVETVDVPTPGPKQVLVYVMAAGMNYNNVWAALGMPVNVIGARQRQGATEDFHIGGSDASGVVWAVGDEVTNVKVGDEVVLSCGMWDENAPDIQAGRRPDHVAPRNKIWGYEENWGSFAQFALVDHYQCFPKPKHLTWEAAAAYMLVGATAYRMLMGWPPHVVNPGDPVLIWGGAGGLGSMAIQIVREAGGVPIAVVSEESKDEYCKQLGAKGVINRRDFNHWGRLPDVDDAEAFGTWMKGARAFGADVLGGRSASAKAPKHRLRAPRRGDRADLDLHGRQRRHGRHLRRHHRLQRGRRPALPLDAPEAPPGLALRERRAVRRVQPAGRRRQGRPVLSRVFEFDEVGECHQLMYENAHPPGNMAILVNAPREGTTELS